MTEPIEIPVIVNARMAEQDIKKLAATIRQLAKDSGVSVKVLGKQLEQAFGEGTNGIKARIQTLKNQIDQIKASSRTLGLAGEVDSSGLAEKQKQLALLEQQLKAQTKLISSATTLAAAEDRVNATAEKRNQMRLDKKLEKEADAQRKLNAALNDGTASAKQFANALMGGDGSGVLKGTLSQASMSRMQNILPGKVNDAIVKDVKEVMGEIQAITQQSTDRVKAIMREMFPKIDVDNINRAGKQLQGLPTLADRARHAFRQLWDTIKGTITAVAVFQVMQLISNFFETATKNAQQFQRALIQLDFAESILSKKGMDIKMQEFDEFIDHIYKKFKYLDQLEVQNIVADVAVSVSEFGLSKEEMVQLMEVVAFIQLKQKMLGEEVMNSSQIINAILDRNTKLLNKYDINLSDSLVKRKAVEMGLIKEGEALDDLSRREAIFALATEQASEKSDELVEAIQGTREELKILAEQDWLNATTQAGLFIETIKTGFLLLYKNVKDGLQSFVGGINIIIEKLKEMDDAAGGAVTKTASSLFGMVTGVGSLSSLIGGLYISGSNVGKTKVDTPTGMDERDDISDDPSLGKEDIAGALEKWNKAIIDEQLKFAQEMEEIEIDLGRKLQDIATEYAKKRADAYRDYQDKVRDINADYANRVNEIRTQMQEEAQQARDDELEREAEFQEKMRQLKEDFLMNLEDALHARDARQVLRLIANYNLQKEQAEREHELDKQKAQRDIIARQQSFQNELRQAKIERAQKLAEARRDYEDKLAELKREQEAEAEAARLDAERKKQDLEREMQNRLEIIAANLVDEFNLTKKGLDAIAKLYLQYYQNVAQVYAAMRAMMNGMSLLGAPTMSPIQQVSPTRSVNTAPNLGGGGGGGMRYAEGGSMVADRPTTVTFGEAGLEVATFTPIGRTGRDVNKVFSNMSPSGAGGAGGSVKIELLLSPDLESRIIDNTLNTAAEVITRVQRGR